MSHDDATINKLINNKNDSSHILDEWLPFNVVFEHAVKALVNGVKDLSKNDLVVLCFTKDVNTHVFVDSEDSNVAVDVEDVVLVLI